MKQCTGRDSFPQLSDATRSGLRRNRPNQTPNNAQVEAILWEETFASNNYRDAIFCVSTADSQQTARVINYLDASVRGINAFQKSLAKLSLY